MVLSLIQQSKLIADPIMSGVVQNIVTADQVIGRLPWRNLGTTDHIIWNRELALPTTVTPSAGAALSSDDTLSYDKVTSYVRRFLIQQAPDVLNAGASGGMVAARASAIAAAAKSLGRKYGADKVAGNSNFTVTVNSFGGTGYTAATIVAGPGHDTRRPIGILRYTHSGTTIAYKAPGDAEFGTAVTVASGVKVYSANANMWVQVTFSAGSASANGDIVFTLSVTGSSTPIDGIKRLVAASQTIAPTGTDGDSVSFGLLLQLIRMVKDTNGPKALVMNGRTVQSIVLRMMAMGGVTYLEASSPFYGGGIDGPIPTFNGVPLLTDDNVTIDETTGSTTTCGRIYCATFGEDAGLCGVYSTAGQDAAAQGEVISTGPNGLVVEDLGPAQAADARIHRVKAYWGIMSATELGLAMAYGIKD